MFLLDTPNPEWNFIEILKLVGGLAGLATLIWKIIETRNRYVELKVEVSNTTEGMSILTEVKNPNSSIKKIDNALLIISPEEEDILEVGKKINQHLNSEDSFRETNQFFDLNVENTIYFEDKYSIIPLKYYYSGVENIHIADETITYRTAVNKSKFIKGNYSVRFYVNAKGRNPRSSQDLFIIN